MRALAIVMLLAGSAAAEDQLEPQIQADLGLSVVFAAYELPVAKHFAIRATTTLRVSPITARNELEHHRVSSDGVPHATPSGGPTGAVISSSRRELLVGVWPDARCVGARQSTPPSIAAASRRSAPLHLRLRLWRYQETVNMDYAVQTLINRDVDARENMGTRHCPTHPSTMVDSTRRRP